MRFGDELDFDIGILLREVRDDRGQDVNGEPIRAGHSELTGEFAFAAGQLPLQIERRALHVFRMREHELACARQYESTGRALEQSTTHRGLQRPEATARGRLRDAQLASGRPETAGARDSQENPNVAPFHHWPHQNCMTLMRVSLFQDVGGHLMLAA